MDLELELVQGSRDCLVLAGAKLLCCSDLVCSLGLALAAQEELWKIQRLSIGLGPGEVRVLEGILLGHLFWVSLLSWLLRLRSTVRVLGVTELFVFDVLRVD